jgi:ribonucleoside-diphosphate reductase beta chain
MAKIFEERIEYKPFEYPIYYTEGWLKQMQAFWLHTEIPMQGDVKDWKEHLNASEKNLVGNILLGFAQTECAVSDYWTGMVTKWFPKHEIKQMAMAFGSQETIHATAYSYLNETLGLEDFKAFMHEPSIAEKFEYLISTEADYTAEDLINSARARKDVVAVLYSFQMRNLLKGIGQQMKWSVRDESLHSKMGCQLFRHMCEEYPNLKEEVQSEVEYAAELMVDMEEKFIDKMFEMGDLENLKAKDLKNFIRRRANEKLVELGYTSKFNFDYKSAEELSWFDHLTGGVTHTDFFAMRSTDYSKAGENESWDEDDIF